MQNTLTIKRKETRDVDTSIPLPYYAQHDNCFYAITGEENNIKVGISAYRDWVYINTYLDAKDLPADALQCSESVFIQTYQRAKQTIEEKFLASCPSVIAA